MMPNSPATPDAANTPVLPDAANTPDLPDAPEAATTLTFSDFGLAPEIVRAVIEGGYRDPTPIQAEAIPVVMAGKDVMGAAQTGTGKTAGFALPIIHRLLPLASSSTSPARHPVRALIIAPTRELADQIYQNFKRYAQYTPLRTAVVFGGVDMKPQTLALRQGCEILIATPGRLLDHVEQKTTNLSQVQILVMDEADRMLDMGFLPDIQRIVNLLSKDRQNLMFSATFSNEIRKLAESFLVKPQLIEVARRNALAENITHAVYRVPTIEHKRAAVTKLVKDHALTQVIVFSNTKIGAGRLARQLEKDGLNAAAIHGDKSQQERLKTLEDFKQGKIVVLVATDVAARGLDISELPAVINYDLPYSPEDYVHRIGRTGRAGAFGMALSLMTSGNDDRLLAEIEKLTKRKMAVEELSVEAEAPGRRRETSRTEERDAERPARRREREREPSRPARHRDAGVSGQPRPSDDPLFYRPYEPPAQPAEGEPARASDRAPALDDAARSAPRRPARTLAVLLGGKTGG
jgi:ATP-dependent RNA helicase RhlE